VTGRAAYACQYCRGQVYPTAGTIFHKSSTSLQLSFWAIFLMSSTRCGLSAKQLEREIGVSYPTAHRMFKQIRSLLTQDDDQLFGEVEMDETYVGGKPRLSEIAHTEDGRVKRGKGTKKKTTVFGAVERGGRIRVEVVPEGDKGGIARRVHEFVLPAATVFTDEWVGYNQPGRSFQGHHRVRHQAKVYVDGNAHTQTIEGFWSLVKRGIGGTYHNVSTQYLQSYLDEYAFRFNRRDGRDPIFWAILDRVVQDRQLAAS
jgi:transposase-like protein